MAKRLAAALARVVDILRWGTLPSEAREIIFGGRLFALRKKDDTLRPIACSTTLRRIASKVACWESRDLITETVGIHQLSFGRPGGVEAAIHAARAALRCRGPRDAFLKLDFSNAFNRLRRDHMLRAVRESAPGRYRLVNQAYSEPSLLLHNNATLISASGIQQGDP